MKDTHMIDRLSHDQLWDQVIRREPGDFLYAVTTMGIYCRAGCPSPRPLRKNVRFFRSPLEAEAAGFRAHLLLFVGLTRRLTGRAGHASRWYRYRRPP